MGLERRKKSGNSFAGSRLNVPGQGIYVVKNTDGEQLKVNPQTDRVPRPSQTPSTSGGNIQTPTPTNTETPTQTPTITPTNTQTQTPTITPTASCSFPEGLYGNNALFEYSGVTFYTSFTETCIAFTNLQIYGFSATTGISWPISTYNSPLIVGDYIWRDPIFNTECIPLDDGYYIIDSLSPSPYIITVSGSTVIDLPTCP